MEKNTNFIEDSLEKLGVEECDLSDRDVLPNDSSATEVELSEDELENVSGGMAVSIIVALIGGGCAILAALIKAASDIYVKNWDRKHKRIEVCTTDKSGRTTTCTVSYG